MKTSLAISAVILLVPAAAGAATLAPTSVSSTALAYDCSAISCSPNPVHASGNATQFSPNAFGQATIDLSKAPSISTNASASVPAGGVGAPSSPSSSGSGEMVLRYEFQLKGPSSAVSVPVHFVSSGSIQITGDKVYAGSLGGGYALAEAQLELEGAQPGQGAVPIVKQDIIVQHFDIDSTGKAAKSFDVDHVLYMGTETVYDVIMRVRSSAAINPNNGAVNGGLLSFATLDPYLFIDPAYQDLFKDYSFAFSGGIVNSLTAETPIPATAPLFGTALLALGGMWRKRRDSVRL